MNHNGVGSKRKPTFENEAREQRRRIASALLDALTKTGSGLQAGDVPHMILFAGWFGGKKLVDRLLSSYDQKAKGRGISLNCTDLQEEVLLSIVVTCLDRLLA